MYIYVRMCMRIIATYVTILCINMKLHSYVQLTCYQSFIFEAIVEDNYICAYHQV